MMGPTANRTEWRLPDQFAVVRRKRTVATATSLAGRPQRFPESSVNSHWDSSTNDQRPVISTTAHSPRRPTAERKRGARCADSPIYQ